MVITCAGAVRQVAGSWAGALTNDAHGPAFVLLTLVVFALQQRYSRATTALMTAY